MTIYKQDNFNVIHLTDGKLIMEAVKLINNNQADGINFNFTKNFPAHINELKLAQNTKYIQINGYGSNRDFDYSAINDLSKIEHLSIYTTDKKEIDYLNFPIIKSTALFWRSKAKSLFQYINLESLFIGKYNTTDLLKFEFLEKLKYLRINTGSIKTLDGIEKLQNLDTLLLVETSRLENINGIEKLSNLRYLKIDNCRNVKNIELVKKLKNVKTLEIGGTTPQPIIDKIN